MRRSLIAWTALLLALVSLLAACGERRADADPDPGGSGQPSDDPAMAITGYIVETKGTGILVTGSVRKDFSANGGASHYFDAVWFSDAGSGLEIGQKVRVWSTGEIAESYPGQGKAKRVEVLEPAKPDGAGMTEAEAIRRALEAAEVDEVMAPSVQAAEYDAANGVWRVEIAWNGKADTVVVEVPDRET
ncbi:YobA family protein [Cohnella hongkongensis]|uniref:YobA family protein n=1 Tax=Cohnella hongkongensis TaxID=178337 RepID=A0ABV9F599_9BACL